MSKEDRHQAVYIPFRCSKKTGDTIARLARESHKPRNEIARELIRKEESNYAFLFFANFFYFDVNKCL